jgi:5'(3')-deoxyribonucleotidase
MTDFVIACDIDEVVFPYLPAWIQYYNRTHGTDVNFEDFHSYNFSHVLVDHDEDYITEVVYKFHDAPEFLEAKPIDGAVEAIRQLQQIGDVHFVTSRQLAISEETAVWLYEYFGIEKDKIHIGNHWCKDSDSVTAKKTKLEMCRLINAKVLIDDSVSYARECAQAGMQALLFDLNGSYGWNKLDTKQGHDNITRVESWHDAIEATRKMKENLA